MSTFDVATARDQFPALKGDQIFFDNAGGSQILGTVVESISNYLTNNNVQLGATYGTSKKSAAAYDAGCKAAAQFINADPDEIVIGPSTTQLFRNLSFAMKHNIGNEIVVSKIDHESNIDPWTDMARRQGLYIRWWEPTDKKNPKLDIQDLKPLLGVRTRLVACTYSSNVLGTINDIRKIADTVHSLTNAVLVVDAVAYAPHRQIDVKAAGVDYLSFSWYKVYGPHNAILYGKREAVKGLLSLGHYFNPSDSLEDKIGLAGSTYELAQAIPPIVAYFGPEPTKTWQSITEHEEKLQSVLLKFLSSRKEVTIYGEPSSNPRLRVATISFSIEGHSSKKVVEAIEKDSNIGFRWGSFYSKRLVDEVLALAPEGVIRVSLVHYNTEDEVKLFVKKLDDYLSQELSLEDLNISEKPKE